MGQASGVSLCVLMVAIIVMSGCQPVSPVAPSPEPAASQYDGMLYDRGRGVSVIPREIPGGMMGHSESDRD